MDINIEKLLTKINYNNYKQHNDFDIIIPEHISCIGIFSAHIFLVASIVAFINKFNMLSPFIFIVYITSLFHWNCPKYSGYTRTIDIIAVLTSLVYGTVTSFTIPLFYTYIWCFGISFSILIFAINEYIYYYQVKIVQDAIFTKDLDKIKAIILSICKKNKYNYQYKHKHKNLISIYFSIDPTIPNTENREKAYIRNTLTHVIAIHFLPGILAIYCMIFSRL
jgi:hypothetical protein